MLLSFALKNYRSFRDEVVLDLQKRSFRTNHPIGKRWVDVTNSVTAIFGANAAGKSNIVRALDILALAIGGESDNTRYVRLLRDPHRTSPSELTEFEVEYVLANVRYRWGVGLSAKGVEWERLEANPIRYWREIFSRKNGEINFGPHSGITKKNQESIKGRLQPWDLFLTYWKNASNLGLIEDNEGAIKWWMQHLMVITHGDRSSKQYHRSLLSFVAKDADFLRAVEIALSSADVGIEKVRIKEREVPPELKDLARKVNDYLAKEVAKEAADAGVEIDLANNPEELEVVLRYLEFSHTSIDGHFTLDESDESVGTRAWFDLAIPALIALVSGRVLVIDEIDSSLHPVLVRHLIEVFADESINEAGAQLIVTSHDLTLVGNHPEPAVAKEGAWLVEKIDACSDLIAWDEFPIRAQHNLEKGYFSGRYGALPMPDIYGFESAILMLRDDIREMRSKGENEDA